MDTNVTGHVYRLLNAAYAQQRVTMDDLDLSSEVTWSEVVKALGVLSSAVQGARIKAWADVLDAAYGTAEYDRVYTIYASLLSVSDWLDARHSDIAPATV